MATFLPCSTDIRPEPGECPARFRFFLQFLNSKSRDAFSLAFGQESGRPTAPGGKRADLQAYCRRLSQISTRFSAGAGGARSRGN
jgi:hypothetical protein